MTTSPYNARGIARCALLFAALAACRSLPERHPVPQHLASQARIPGIPLARAVSHEPESRTEEWLAQSEEQLKRDWGGIMNTEHNYLALSGGGANGAFGAGLLCGWTERGDRPEFTVVTGISAGSLIAPFAFLGSEYDTRMRQLLTTHSTEVMVEERSPLAVLTGDSVMDTSGMAHIIAEYFNQDVLDAIAQASRGGRRLLVATTDMDTGLPVIWNLSRIAMSGEPRALPLLQQIILASCSIPVGFPPVLIEVEANGETYDEMHVDGGVTAQVFWFPVEIHWKSITKRLKVPGQPNVYVIRNGHMNSTWTTTAPDILSIAARSLDTLIRTQGVGDLYQIYVAAKRDGLIFHLASVPDSFDGESTELFDMAYMQALFQTAHDLAVDGYPWAGAPDGVEDEVPSAQASER